jgi:hypothetical protein
MATRVAEVPESQAQGKTKAIYEDIKSVLRAPVVSLFWRSLAVHADFLEVAWTAFKPNAQTAFFERRADELRVFAVESTSSWTSIARPPDAILPAIQVFQYLNPKVLLAVATLRSASTGLQPRLIALTRDEKRQVVPGVPAAAPQLNLPETFADDTVSPDVMSVLGIRELGCTPTEVRMLASEPEWFSQEWPALQSLLQSPRFALLAARLRGMADEVVGALPYRIDLGPHVLRHSGLSEADIDAVQDTLSDWYRAAPLLLTLTACLARSGMGAAEAAQSPFPITLT